MTSNSRDGRSAADSGPGDAPADNHRPEFDAIEGPVRLQMLEQEVASLQRRLARAELELAARSRNSEAKPAVRTASGRRPIVVFTAVIGSYDALKQPLVVPDSVDFVCFSDREIEDSGVWQVRRIDHHAADPTRAARFVKTHPHVYFPDHPVSVWIDGNLLLTGDITELVSRLGDSDFAAFTHPHRGCVYDEADEIIRRGGLDADATVRQHVARYRDRGFPERSGLIETNVLVRRHLEPPMVRLAQVWWREILNGSKRDQLSLPYALRKTNTNVTPLADAGVSVRNHPVVRRFQHGEKSTYEVQEATEEQRRRTREIGAMTDAFGRPITAAKKAPRKGLARHSLDVVVCVHNGLDDVRRCLASVQSSLLAHHGIVIVDDGSSEPTRAFLADLAAEDERITLVRRETAGGYTVAANAGVAESSADLVIMLNSDTVVPENWWLKMATVAFSAPDVGMVGPLSNAASWQSVPEILTSEGTLAVNSIPDGLTVEDMDRFAERHATTAFPSVELLNGFCIGIRREVFDTIGAFDERAFPRGYGEENDFCFRAVEAGFRALVATNCYIYHRKSVSYTPAKRDSLSAEGSRAFRAKYPKHRIGHAIESTKHHPLLAEMRRAFEELDAEAKETSRKQSELRALVIPKIPSPPGDPRFFDLEPDLVEANRRLGERYLAEPVVRPDRILWFVPGFDHILRGGIRTIFSIAQELSRTWGTTSIFSLVGGKLDLESARQQAAAHFPDLRFDLLSIEESIDPDTLPGADIGICTLWTTAYCLAKYRKCRAKLYLVQDYEPSFYRSGTTSSLIEQTYRLGFYHIANTEGVAREVARHSPNVSFFVPGVDRSVYHPQPASGRDGHPPRVVFYGRPSNPRNAFKLGVAALKQLKLELGDDVQIISVGARFDPRDHGAHGVIENWGVLPTLEQVADLYRSASVGLVFMYSAHPSYQPLEYMACGCATVTNHNPSNTWLFKDTENCRLVDSLATPIASTIHQLLASNEDRERIVAGGLETVERLDWDTAFDRIREIISNPRRSTLDAIVASEGRQISGEAEVVGEGQEASR